ncbi:MAG: 3-oxoacyl-ACP reductase, partial [Pseudomonadota bacterium]
MSTNKVAVLTAAGSGMGADAAKRLAADGFGVAIL